LKIPFDSTVIECQIQGVPVTASDTSLAAYSIKDLWGKLEKSIETLPQQKKISLK